MVLQLAIQQMLISHNVSFDDGSVFSIRARRLQIDSICSVYTIIRQQPPLGYCDMCGTKGREEKKESSARIHQSNSFKVLCFQSGIFIFRVSWMKRSAELWSPDLRSPASVSLRWVIIGLFSIWQSNDRLILINLLCFPMIIYVKDMRVNDLKSGDQSSSDQFWYI